MTDKIIIDGIDVSECMWFVRAEGRYVKDYCHCYSEFDICKEKTDCYYKQLQRKTAECERYKQALDNIENRIETYQCGDCDAEVSECAWCDMKDILDIIKNKGR